MVLQRDARIPVFGQAPAGKRVSVSLGDKRASATSDKNGKWQVELPAMTAGGPFELAVAADDTSVVLQDVLIGDVWVCSGQSNMEFALNNKSRGVDNASVEAAQANYPELRLMKVPRLVSFEPMDDLTTASRWAPCTPKSASDFSAVGYYFGSSLQKHLGIPIGLIQSSWGGTEAESWTSEKGLLGLPTNIGTRIREQRSVGNDRAALKDLLHRQQQAWDARALAADKGVAGGWGRPDADITGWKTLSVPPRAGESTEPLRGMLWLRRDFTVVHPSSGGVLAFDAIGDRDTAWLNGKKIGSQTTVSVARRFKFPVGALHDGTNTLAIQVQAWSGKSGALARVKDVSIKLGDSSVPLTGEWKSKLAASLYMLPVRPDDPMGPHRPGGLYNGMIAPIVKLPIKGAAWYQGEQNAPEAWDYRTYFPAMIKDWRKAWKQDFPFVFVQLPNYDTSSRGMPDTAWPELREAQAMTLAVPATGMAVAIDQGDPNDIHPRVKKEVGRRLALAARHAAYGDKGVCSGPMYHQGSLKREGPAMRVGFDSVGAGLVARGAGELRGFTIAGKDKVFRPAKARIDGQAVVVESDAVADPVAVRYAFTCNPDCNLFNRDGLPASPFRTDDWPAATRRPE